MTRASTMREVPLDQIRAEGNVRSFRMDDEHGRGLRDSVCSVGVLQPILLSPLSRAQTNGHRYLLVAGFRRYSAACEAGLRTVPARIARMSESEILLARITENAQRLDPHPVEEARAIRKFLELTKSSRDQLARSLGRSQGWVSQRLKLLELPEEVLEIVARNSIGSAQLAAILQLPPDDREGLKMALRSAASGASASAVTHLVRRRNFIRSGAALEHYSVPPSGECALGCACVCFCCQSRRRA